MDLSLLADDLPIVDADDQCLRGVYPSVTKNAFGRNIQCVKIELANL
jgi:hypothetical protein